MESLNCLAPDYLSSNVILRSGIFNSYNLQVSGSDEQEDADTWGIKAFESIDHAKRLVKLRSLGVYTWELECFRSYMHDRQQYIRIGSEMSEMCKSTYRVPQGSILGPVLF